ncbi:MAG: hypothetical protein E7206_04745 [Clostridium beijerinckii]|nr:hypothetical protein [Clostridium beijerinckii]
MSKQIEYCKFKVLNTKDLAKELGYTGRTMFLLLKTNRFPAIKIGRDYYITLKQFKNSTSKHTIYELQKDNDKLLDKNDLLEAFHCKKDKLNQLVKLGVLPLSTKSSCQKKPRYCIYESELQKWFESYEKSANREIFLK